MRTNEWSGVYYVDTGGEPTENVSGETVFEDRVYYKDGNLYYNRIPSLRVNGKPKPREFKVTPQNGKMILFPGTLTHRVEPYKGEKVRITIAFNLKHPDFGVFFYLGHKKLTLRNKIGLWLRKNIPWLRNTKKRMSAK